MKIKILFNVSSKLLDLFSDLTYLFSFPHVNALSQVILMLMIIWPYLVLYYVKDYLKVLEGRPEETENIVEKQMYIF